MRCVEFETGTVQPRRSRWCKVPYFLAAALLLLGAGHAHAQGQPPGLVLEGDPQYDPAHPEGWDDWENVNGYVAPFGGNADIYSGTLYDQVGTVDTTFTGGSTKDDLPIAGWLWHTGGGFPDKDDLTHGMAALYRAGDEEILFFGADRYARNGDSQLGFWLIQDSVGLNPDGSFYGEHQDNDLLILANFLQGGSAPEVPKIYKWRWDGLGSDGYLDLIEGLSIEAADATVNQIMVESPWEYYPKFDVDDCPEGSWCFDPGAFFEGGVNLDSVGVSPCFSTFIIETRASQSVDATLKDFILGNFNTTPQVSIPDVYDCPENFAGGIELCATVTGGSPPYRYSWDGGPYVLDQNCLTVYAPGRHCVDVLDSEDCAGSGCGEAFAYPGVSVSIADCYSCPDNPDTPENEFGCTLVATPSGGTAPFYYSWDGGDFILDNNELAVTTPGQHCVVVRDANGCEGNDCGDAIAYPAVSVTVADCNSCPDNPDTPGNEFSCTLVATATGGTGSLYYSWDGGDFVLDDNELTVTAPGEHCVVVRDDNGCEDSDCGDAVAYPGVSVTVADCSSCPDDPDTPGNEFSCTLVATATGGTGSLYYSWDGGDFIEDADELTVGAPGEHCVVVRDDNGCEDSDCGEAIELPGLDVAVDDCYSCPDNPDTPENEFSCTLTANVSGGVAPLYYSWDGGDFIQDNDELTVRAPGEHCVVVRDANDCEGDDCGTAIAYPGVSVTVADCNSCPDNPDTPGNEFSCTLVATATGGTGSLYYSWDDGPFIEDDDELTVTAPGVHCVVVRDDNDCEDSDCGEAFAYPGVSVTVADCNSCPDNPDTPGNEFSCTLVASPSGGTPPLYYSWDGGDFIEDNNELTVTEPGQHCVTVRDANGCEDADCGDAIAYPGVSVTVADCHSCPDNPDTPGNEFSCTLIATPAGGTPPLYYSWDGGDFIENNNGLTVTEPGRHCVVIRDANGCEDSDCGDAIAYPGVSVTVADCYDCPEDPDCDPDNPFECTLVATATGGTAPLYYSWDGGDFVLDANQLVVTAPGEHCVVVRDDNGCEDADCGEAIEYPAPICNLIPPTEEPPCNTEGNRYCGPAGHTSYRWELVPPVPDGWVITDPDSQCVEFTTGNDIGPATFMLYVTNADGCVGCCDVTFGCQPQEEEFCSFTQGWFGNAGGSFNGEGTLEMIQRLITGADPLVVGVVGMSSITFEDGREACVIKRLPGGGDADALPGDLGDVIVTPPEDCSEDDLEDVLRPNSGRFNNVLISQTITLDLNTHYDPDLPLLGLCHYMKSQGALCGPDGICGTDDDELDPGPDGTHGTGDEPIENREIPWSVLYALDDPPYSGRTVGGLLQLANDALGGAYVPGASYADISDAVSAINELFDECAFLIDCRDVRPVISRQIVSLDSDTEISAVQALPTQFRLAQNVPNPFGAGTMIHFDLPERSLVRLTVYDITGRIVDVLADQTLDAGFHAVTWDPSDRTELSAGVYFYTTAMVGLESGKHFAERRKMILTR